MSKLLLKLILLLTIMLIVLISINSIILPKIGYVYKDSASIIKLCKRQLIKNNIIKYDKSKLNILAIGNSTVLAGFMPKIFDDLFDNKTLTYNLALPATPTYTYCYILNDYLKNNPAPDYIIVKLDINIKDTQYNSFLYYSTIGASFKESIDYALNITYKASYYYLLNVYVFYESISKYVVNYITNNRAISEHIKINDSVLSQMISDRGYYFIKEQSRYLNDKLPDNYTDGLNPDLVPIEIDITNDTLLHNFFDLCKRNNIKVLLISGSPRLHTSKQYERMPLHNRQILIKYDNVYQSSEGYKKHFYANEFFSDPVHLNQNGAYKYTIEIANEFKEVFGELK